MTLSEANFHAIHDKKKRVFNGRGFPGDRQLIDLLLFPLSLSFFLLHFIQDIIMGKGPSLAAKKAKERLDQQNRDVQVLRSFNVHQQVTDTSTYGTEPHPSRLSQGQG